MIRATIAAMHVKLGCAFVAVVALGLCACDSDDTTSSGSGGDGGNGGGSSGPATTFEECQQRGAIDLTCDDAGLELVAFVPGVTCTGMASFTDGERVIFETDVDLNVTGIRIEEVPPSPLGGSVAFAAPAPMALDMLPQQLDWPGRYSPSVGAGAITFVEYRAASGRFEIDKPPVDAVGMADNRGTFTMSGGEVDRMVDGSEVLVATPDADVRGCFRLYGDAG